MSKTQGYIHFDFDKARKMKWQSGVQEYRTSSEQGFVGEHCEEGFQECLDLYNIMEDFEKLYSMNLSIQKSMVRSIALMWKVQHRRLSGQ
jgi:hypothetical protein